MKRRFALPALSALVLLSAPVLPGQRSRPSTPDVTPRVFSIRGNLRFANTERPAEMVKLELRRFSGEVVGTTFTRTNGEFEFSGLGPGTFYVVAEEQGYEPLREAVEITTMSRYSLILYLKKASSLEAGEKGSAVSAHELSMPQKARDAYRKGVQQLYEKKNSAASLPHFQRAVASAPNYYEAYFQIGIAYGELNRAHDAEEAFRRSIELSKERFAEPLIALGTTLCNQQQFAEAETLIRRGLAVDASIWHGHFELARTLFSQNRLDEAEKSLGEVIQRRAEFAPAYILRANVRIRQKNYAAVLPDIEEYLRLDPTGEYSDQARQTREQIRRVLQNAKASSSTPPPKP